MRTSSLLALCLVVVFVATPAIGSEPGGPRPAFHSELYGAWDDLTRQLQEWGGRWGEHFARPERRGERPLISFMLRHRDDLRLSPEQVRSLERVRADFERLAIKNEADLRVAEMDLSALLEADPVDLKPIEAKVREIERLRADLRFARIRAIEQGKGQLSGEQRERLQSLLSGSRYPQPRPGAYRQTSGEP